MEGTQKQNGRSTNEKVVIKNGTVNDYFYGTTSIIQCY